ncbi:hypothetical protein HK096_008318, partial [Nowakowskiella sp. JEL0078]
MEDADEVVLDSLEADETLLKLEERLRLGVGCSFLHFAALILKLKVFHVPLFEMDEIS